MKELKEVIHYSKNMLDLFLFFNLLGNLKKIHKKHANLCINSKLFIGMAGMLLI